MRKGFVALLSAAWAIMLASAAAMAQADPAASVGGERVVALPLQDGTGLRVLYAAPEHPWATIVMLPGGSGDIGAQEGDGAEGDDIRHGDNFVVRTRALWSARGYAVLIPDTIAHASLRGWRSSPAYAAVVAQLAAFARTRAAGPVFLLGTSQGSIAAMNGAAHAAPGAIAGVVLTESVSRMGGSHETVFSAHPQAVTAPALIVANRDDACPVAPPEDAPRIAAQLTHAREVRILAVSGGISRSRRACGSLTPHGLYGIEPEVIDGISDWMHRHG
ncbi:MAG TPA: alpha/beta hydrolase [Novosphingobium sp.]|nr:alpha/beta hydrolase [Novosphingobium sp.]